MTNHYNIIAENAKSTVVAEYVPTKNNAAHYQSEYELEREFIRLLQKNGYAYLNITQHDDLLQNLRTQLEKLNQTAFSAAEWRQIRDQYLVKTAESIAEKTKKVQENYIFL